MFRLPMCLFSWFGWVLTEIFWLPTRMFHLGLPGAIRAFLINVRNWWRIECWRAGFLSPGVHPAGQINRRVSGGVVSFDIRLLGGHSPVALLLARVGGRPIGLFLVRGPKAQSSRNTPIPSQTAEGLPFRLATEPDDVLSSRLPGSANAVAKQTLTWLNTVLS